ncbi:DUF5431 family protein [Franconibacter helveticus]|uniref:DUF5431 family protein n=1 Tax=Franconibacter helveticus TaxID=357240 RepID=UPI0032E489DC
MRRRIVALALEAFCLMRSAEMRMCGEAERRKPRRSMFINQRGLLTTPKHRQSSLLPAARQGEESNEAAAKPPALVLINCL